MQGKLKFKQFLRTELVYAQRSFWNAVVNVFPDGLLTNRYLRPLAMHVSGVSSGKGCRVWKTVYITRPSNLSLGQGVLINRHVYIDSYDKVEIGNNVSIGYRAVLITSTHETESPSRRAGEIQGKPIVVEDGCWIGAGAIIGPGVRLSRGCVVSAGSVVMRSMPPNVLVVGNPARVIQELKAEQGTGASIP